MAKKRIFVPQGTPAATIRWLASLPHEQALAEAKSLCEAARRKARREAERVRRETDWTVAPIGRGDLLMNWEGVRQHAVARPRKDGSVGWSLRVCRA